jgi:hypothetical protein
MPLKFAAALLCAFPVLLHAQEEPRLFQVEVVIFEQPGGGSDELPPLPPDEDPMQQYLMRWEADDADAPEPAAAEQPGAADEEGLPEHVHRAVIDHELDGIARRLNTGGYRLLWHQAWVQPAVSRTDGAALPLPTLAALGGGPADGLLEGSLALASGRFLHLALDLSLPAPGGASYRLEQWRRVRSGETHYFDHPRLGVIAHVTRLEPEDVPPELETEIAVPNSTDISIR